MKTKKYFQLKSYINKEIKKGDNVNIIDGSGLTAINSDDDFYIVNSYCDYIGVDQKIMDITGVVVETGINNIACSGVCGNMYIQDCVVRFGDGLFRTCSSFLKINNRVVPEYTMEELVYQLGHEFKIKK